MFERVVFNPILKLLNRRTDRERTLKQSISQIVGSSPSNMGVYRLALLHTSAAKGTSIEGFKESNERLEYLGDAILGAIIAEYLFKKFPYKDEGFLTEIRSRIVNRESLNNLSRKIGLNKIIEFDNNRKSALAFKSMHGDALEAFVGAVYLDKGFKRCRKFIIKGLLPHFDIEKLVLTNPNFKSLVIEWAQRESKELRFDIIDEKISRNHREFIAQVLVDDQPFSTGSGYSKKKAEQSAAEKACELLNLK
ncbi:MAG: ribonuclease III [Bacteroidota bacterium]